MSVPPVPGPCCYLLCYIYSLYVLCAYAISQTFKIDPRIIDCENVYCSGLRWKQGAQNVVLL